MAAPPDPTAIYRGQQGMAPITQSYDPVVVQWIVKAAHQHGADPVVMLATALQESGARLHPQAGDGGTSHGTFQFHEGGALADHPPEWASTYPSFVNRAVEFARLGVHHGKGAADVQRPLDRQLYAQGVDHYMPTAAAIIKHFLGTQVDQAKTPAAPPAGPSVNQADPTADEGPVILRALADLHTASSLHDATLAFSPPSAPSTPKATVRQPHVRATPSAPETPGGSTPRPSGKTADFEGTTIAAWMKPSLVFARQHGWKGKLTSGVRSTALQAQLYARYQAGGNLAAKPGQSNHEIQNGGAFDATDAPQLNSILKSFKGQRPIWARSVGLNDTPHFSLTGR